MGGEGRALGAGKEGRGERVWEGDSAAADDVGRAVRSARGGLGGWSALSLDERCGVVGRFAAVGTERKEALAEAIGRETGKPLW
ncbi:aldehyde dehydrogenase family protein, partial [Paraburkholderia ginsengiterrae]|uniref:aldehyde dehydrogenase family protein n=1 Tax=Paraburkholderia ginsengiterrae TaxID=1462993 RepID=UPI000AF37934